MQHRSLFRSAVAAALVAALATLQVVGIATAAPPAKPPVITWTPVSLSLTVSPGQNVSASATFRASKKVSNLTLSTTGAVAPFVTVTPGSIKSALVAVSLTEQVSVTIPQATALGDYTGSVVVNSGKTAQANALPLTVHVVAPAIAHIYWSQHLIGRADIDGSNPDTLILGSDTGSAVGLAVDDQYVYWTVTNSTPAIGRANLDGSNPNPTFITLPLDAPNLPAQPIGLAVDGQHIYWTDADYPSIGRANLDGSNVEPGFIDLGRTAEAGGLGLPTGVAVDGRHVYWSDQVWQGGSIGRADIDGSDVDKDFYVTGGGTNWGIVATPQYLYWTWSLYPDGGFIGRMNLDGSSPSTGFISTSEYATLGLAVDDSHIYWAGAFGTTGRISRADLDGANRVPDFIATGPTSYFLALGR